MKLFEKIKHINLKEGVISNFKIFKNRYLKYIILLSLLILFNIDINHIVALFKGVDFNIPKQSGNILAPFFAGLCLLLLLGSFIIKENGRGGVKLFKIILIILTIPITIFNIGITWYILFYGSFVDVLAVDVILATNPSEAREFIDQVFSYHIFIALALAPIPYILIYKMKPVKINSKIVKSVLTLIFILIFLLTYKQRWVYRDMAVTNIIQTYIVTLEDRKLFEDLQKNTSLPKFDNVTNLITDNRKETFIFVLSESQNKYHFSIYGYGGDTTPFLNSIKNKLYIFNDIKSVNINTNLSLEKMLTFSDHENKIKGYNAGDIITLFKQAGFKTYWISNQYYLGYYDNFYSVIAYNSDFNFYTNHTKFEPSDNSKDIAIIPHLKEALNDDYNKKFIVLHLMGSHTGFKNRYPNGFGKPTNFLNEKDKYIEEYDNSIRYTDYFLKEVFKSVEKIDSESYIIFTSDHGEDVYDTYEDKYLNRNFTNILKGMVDMPFFIYLNDEYKKAHPEIVKNIENSLNRKYQLDRFPHTLLDLSFLRCEKHNSEDSVISPNFQEKRRHIGDINLEEIK